MAKSSCSEGERNGSENLCNSFTASTDVNSNICSNHSSKRKKLQKPNAEEKKITVETFLKTEKISRPRKPIGTPCRRSERKIIPSSLWDNAVINPFFERKRRKMHEYPLKTLENGSKTTVADDAKVNGCATEPLLNNSTDLVTEDDSGVPPKIIGLSPEKNHVELNKNFQGDACSDSNLEGDGTDLNGEGLFDIPGHLRIRRSSRKHSSSVSSISDSKYTIKQEHLHKLAQSVETSYKRVLSEACVGEVNPAENPDEDPANEPGVMVNGSVYTESEHRASLSAEVNLESNDHIVGCENANFKAIDDEIEVRDTTQMDTTTPADDSQPHDPIDEITDSKKVGILNDITDTQKQETVHVAADSPSQAPQPVKRKRGRKPRGSQDKASANTDTLLNKSSLENGVMTSREGLELIDGSSLHRLYKMRTRRQNSSTEDASVKSGTGGATTSTTPVAVKRRSTSRSNSSKSEEGEHRRPKQMKPDILCSFCLQTEDERGEGMISCCLCGASGHPSCLQFNSQLTRRVKLYSWECIECKKCEICRNSGDDATLLFCDDCDKGYHMSCLRPPLAGEPDGHWSCAHCAEGSTYWSEKQGKKRNLHKSRKKKRSDKASKRKQLLDDLAMFHEAQSRAQNAMTEEVKSKTPTKGSKKKGTPAPPNIQSIEIGCYEVNAWYSSPYPAEYATQHKLYICEFCLKYMKSGVISSRHAAKCPARCPPGDEIYRKDTVSVFEVDGRKNKTYCQNLCLLAKLFLDHKTLYYDVEPFLFYILTEYDRKGCHIVGYFSKEKNSFLSYNVSCILVIPPYMKHGYGKMLIDFSYALSRKEGKLGSPEKPLSDLGLVSYRAYWKDKLLEYFCSYTDTQITIKHISQTLGFNPYDIVSTLQAYGMIKYHKANHYVLKRPDMLAGYKRKQASHANLPTRSIDMAKLKWIPHNKRELSGS